MLRYLLRHEQVGQLFGDTDGCGEDRQSGSSGFGEYDAVGLIAAAEDQRVGALHLPCHLLGRQFVGPAQQPSGYLQRVGVGAYLRIIHTGADEHQLPVLAFLAQHLRCPQQPHDVLGFLVEAGDVEESLL